MMLLLVIFWGGKQGEVVEGARRAEFDVCLGEMPTTVDTLQDDCTTEE